MVAFVDEYRDEYGGEPICDVMPISRSTSSIGLAPRTGATLVWVDWFNNRRLLEPIGYVPPTEYEAAYYRQQSQAMVA